MKYGRSILVIAVLLVWFSLFNAAYGQPTEYTVKLNSYSLQVTCPAEVMPGDSVTVNVQGSPTQNGVYLQSLIVTIYYPDASGLHELATENLVVSSSPNAYNNYLSYGYTGSFSRNFTVNVPENASRTSLVAVFSESVLPSYQGWTAPAYQTYRYSPFYPYYSSYPFYSYYSYYPYHLSYPFYSPFYPYYSSYPFYSYYPNSPSYVPPVHYPYYYPYSSYSYSSDQAMAPLSYIKANTPESMALQSQNQMLQQQLSQVQGQNQQLQTKISQQNATINQLNQQLTGLSGTVQTYQVLALAFGVLALMLLVAFTISVRSRRTRQTVETKTS